MKKITIYIAMIASLLAVSCNRSELEVQDGETGTVRISLDAGQMETRADDPESVIDHFDWFFFSDEAGTSLLYSGRASGLSKEFDVTEYENLKGTSYVYVLANYPDAIDHSKAWKLEDLLDLPVKTSVQSGSNFVMDSYDKDNDAVVVKLSPTSANEVKAQTIYLRRIAAKIVLNIKVAESATSAGGLKWVPTTETKDFYAYFVNAYNGMDVTKVDGEPVVGSEVGSGFFSYSHTHDDLSGSGLEWQTTASYSYPQTFESSDPRAPYFKVQMPWVNVDPSTGNITDKGSHMFYYKVLLPDLTEIKRNTKYVVNLNLDKIGGTQEDYVVVTNVNYYVSDWFSPSNWSYSGYFSARFLDTARDTMYIYGANSITVPVTSSHPISVEINYAKKYDFKNRDSVNVTGATVVPDDKLSFTLTKELDNVISSSGFDCSPITYKVTITHDDNLQPTAKQITIIQYPPIYIAQYQSNGSVFVNGQSYSLNAGNRPQGNNGAYYVYNNDTDRNLGDNIGSVENPSNVNGSGDNNNQYQYNIYISVLSSNDNVIGDSRIGYTSVGNLGFATYASRKNDLVLDNTVSSKYKASGEDTQNVIAPAFKIASSYGKTTLMNYEHAKERCASYQENGYPAGRWRLPTAAEIDFVISLSENNHIPTLFGAGPNYNNQGNLSYYAAYWSGGGWAYCGKNSVIGGQKQIDLSSDGQKTTNGTTYNVTTPTGNGTSYTVRYNNTNYTHCVYTRCVYDIWYWGEEKMNNSGTKIAADASGAATQWLGFKMD